MPDPDHAAQPGPTDAHRAEAAAARRELERLLAAAPAAPALALPGNFLDDVERFVDLLLAANARLNLTRVVESPEVARLHLLDALSGLPAVDAAGGGPALDLGSGGGVPGIVLAIARPELPWTLVDSVAKKVDALRAFADALRLPNVEAVAARAEVLGRDPASRASYRLVTARACAALPILVEYAMPLLEVGGRLVAWKGPIREDELTAGRAASALLGGEVPEVLPSGHRALGDHRLVVIRKVAETPDRYPRRPGVPARRPLA